MFLWFNNYFIQYGRTIMALVVFSRFYWLCKKVWEISHFFLNFDRKISRFIVFSILIKVWWNQNKPLLVWYRFTRQYFFLKFWKSLCVANYLNKILKQVIEITNNSGIKFSQTIVFFCIFSNSHLKKKVNEKPQTGKETTL